MTETRFGIVGCGTAAVPVCAALATCSLGKITMLHDVSDPLARELSEKYKVPYTTALDELLKSDVDAVYIAVPHHLLAGLARKALVAGKHVLVEKPMALSLAEIDELIALAEGRGLTLGVFYEMRYANGFALARELVQADAIGKIFGAKLQTLIDKKQSYWQMGYMGRAANPWRCEKEKAGGGVTLMNTSHILDGLWYVTGMQVTRVSAEYGTLVADEDVEVEDTLAATLRFDNGAIGNLYSAAHSAGAKGSETIEIYGTKGTLRVPDPYGLDPLQVYLRQGWRAIPAGTWHTIPVEPTNVFLDALNGFTEAVHKHEPAPIDGYAARRVLEVVLAMYRAADEQCTVELGAKESLYEAS